MTIESICNLARQVRCFGIAEGVEGRLAEARSVNLTHEELLEKVLHDELEDRREKSAARLLTRAKFRHAYSLEDWDNSYDRGVNQQKLKELALLGFYNNRENLIIVGSTGSGKSHLAIALGRRLCSKETSVRFFSTNLLFEEIAAQKAAGRYLVFAKSLAKVGVIILDDFGLRGYSHDEASALIDILEERYRQGTLMITSQVKPAGWKELFEDPVVAEAIIDRIVNPGQLIQLKGTSYRAKLKDGGKKGEVEKP